MSNRDYYKVLLVGGSGKGKTMSFRDMNPETTGFLNIENKPLPFKNKFINHARCLTLTDVSTHLQKFANDPKITSIGIDSLSSYMDMVLLNARATKKGFDIWNHYNESIAKFLNYIKSIEKEVFITAHYEWVQDENGAKEQRVKVKGKEWEGVIEKEFTMVLYATNTFEVGKPVYKFNTVMEDSSAKCPPDIFGKDVYQIDNNTRYVLDKIQEFVN